MGLVVAGHRGATFPRNDCSPGTLLGNVPGQPGALLAGSETGRGPLGSKRLLEPRLVPVGVDSPAPTSQPWASGPFQRQMSVLSREHTAQDIQEPGAPKSPELTKHIENCADAWSSLSPLLSALEPPMSLFPI